MKKVRISIMSWILALVFIFHQCAYAQPLPAVNLSNPVGISQLTIEGLSFYPDDPFRFDLLTNVGDQPITDQSLHETSLKLIKYFLACLSIPEKEMWVNLSPLEPDRIVGEGLKSTQLGMDLLVQDYVLKETTSSVLSAQNEISERLWNEILEAAYQESLAIPEEFNLANKIWIVPDTADIYVNKTNVFIVNSHLKVLMKEDHGVGGAFNEESQQIQRIVADKLIPLIEKMVNESPKFSNLRQIYHALILAQWYKRNLKNSLLRQAYVDRGLTNHIGSEGATIEQIYQKYLQVFKDKTGQMIREDYDPFENKVIVRQMIVGGVDATRARSQVVVPSADWLDAITDKNIYVTGFRITDGAMLQESGTKDGENTLLWSEDRLSAVIRFYEAFPSVYKKVMSFKSYDFKKDLDFVVFVLKNNRITLSSDQVNSLLDQISNGEDWLKAGQILSEFVEAEIINPDVLRGKVHIRKMLQDIEVYIAEGQPRGIETLARFHRNGLLPENYRFRIEIEEWSYFSRDSKEQEVLFSVLLDLLSYGFVEILQDGQVMTDKDVRLYIHNKILNDVELLRAPVYKYGLLKILYFRLETISFDQFFRKAFEIKSFSSIEDEFVLEILADLRRRVGERPTPAPENFLIFEIMEDFEALYADMSGPDQRLIIDRLCELITDNPGFLSLVYRFALNQQNGAGVIEDVLRRFLSDWSGQTIKIKEDLLYWIKFMLGLGKLTEEFVSGPLKSFLMKYSDSDDEMAGQMDDLRLALEEAPKEIIDEDSETYWLGVYKAIRERKASSGQIDELSRYAADQLIDHSSVNWVFMDIVRGLMEQGYLPLALNIWKEKNFLPRGKEGAQASEIMEKIARWYSAEDEIRRVTGGAGLPLLEIDWEIAKQLIENLNSWQEYSKPIRKLLFELLKERSQQTGDFSEVQVRFARHFVLDVKMSSQEGIKVYRDYIDFLRNISLKGETKLAQGAVELLEGIQLRGTQESQRSIEEYAWINLVRIYKERVDLKLSDIVHNYSGTGFRNIVDKIFSLKGEEIWVSAYESVYFWNEMMGHLREILKKNSSLKPVIVPVMNSGFWYTAGFSESRDGRKRAVRPEYIPEDVREILGGQDVEMIFDVKISSTTYHFDMLNVYVEILNSQSQSLKTLLEADVYPVFVDATSNRKNFPDSVRGARNLMIVKWAVQQARAKDWILPETNKDLRNMSIKMEGGALHISWDKWPEPIVISPKEAGRVLETYDLDQSPADNKSSFAGSVLPEWLGPSDLENAPLPQGVFYQAAHMSDSLPDFVRPFRADRGRNGLDDFSGYLAPVQDMYADLAAERFHQMNILMNYLEAVRAYGADQPLLLVADKDNTLTAIRESLGASMASLLNQWMHGRDGRNALAVISMNSEDFIHKGITEVMVSLGGDVVGRHVMAGSTSWQPHITKSMVLKDLLNARGMGEYDGPVLILGDDDRGVDSEMRKAFQPGQAFFVKVKHLVETERILEILLNSGVAKDSAMLKEDVGGIDLDGAQLNLNVSGGMDLVAGEIDEAQLQHLMTYGFQPIILHISPLRNVSQLLN